MSDFTNNITQSFTDEFYTAPIVVGGVIFMSSTGSLSATGDINNPPEAPTLVAPTNGATIQTLGGYTFEWTHNDIESDPQVAYSFRRRVYR